MRLFKGILLVFFTSIILFPLIGSACTAGNLYNPDNVAFGLNDGWYLNHEHPALCSGNVTAVSFHSYLISNILPNYCIWWALFEPINNNHYAQVENSLQRTCRDYVTFITDRSFTIQVNSPFPISAGSVVGVYISFPSFSNLPVIGDVDNSFDDISRLCRAAVSGPIAPTNNMIKCNPEFFRSEDLVLHMEVNIQNISCHSLPKSPLYGDIHYDTNIHELGGTVQYSCDNGYYLVGDVNRTCLANGDWSGSEPICLPECSYEYEYIEIDNGHTLGSSSIMIFYCDDGYILNGPHEIVCQSDGEWSDTLPTCDHIECPIIQSTSLYLYYTPSFLNQPFVYQTVVTFDCFGKYNLVGNATLFCMANGQWNDTIPRCKRKGRSRTVQQSSADIASTAADQVTISSPSVICSRSACTETTQTFTTISAPSPLFNIGKTPSVEEVPSVGLFDNSSKLSILNIVIIVSVATVVPFIFIILSMLTFCLCLLQKRQRKRNKTIDSNGGEHLYSVIVTSSLKRSTMPESYYSTLLQKYDYDSLSDQDSSDYEEPAREESQLYIQLDRIKVKKINRDELFILGLLGTGQFGNVHYSVWYHNNDKMNVAAKELQDKSLERNKVKFLQEATLMGQFQHKNVLKLHGIVQDKDDILLVIELMVKGDLRNFLQQTMRKKVVSTTPFMFLDFCRQICDGMCYLSRKGYVHRDLAARNVLVSEDYSCKISDFGMSRDLEDGYYLAQRGGVIPFKWTAPEAINFRKYSNASDVWSYGCLLYEIWSLGCRPFDHVDSRKVLLKLERGYRLPPPPGCPKKIYEIMIDSWNPEPKDRPRFLTIMNDLLNEDHELLHIPEEDKASHPQAGKLTENIEAGNNMYKTLQNSYCYYFTLD